MASDPDRPVSQKGPFILLHDLAPVRTAVILAFSIAIGPGTGMAQLPILEGLFKNVSDANLYGTLAWFVDRPEALAGRLDNGEPKSGPMLGLGFEVSFDIGEFSSRKRDSTPAARPTRDTVEIRLPQPDGSLLIYKPHPKDIVEDKADNRWLAELAIGYSELRHFESARAGVALLGTLRELPSVSLYFNHLPAGWPHKNRFGWYLGFRTGLAHLHGFRGYVGDPEDGVPDSIYSGGGTAFQFGALAGLVVHFGPLNLFLEPAYTRRRFSSIEWGGISGTISDALPRSLDMSTWGLSTGAQISIRS
jgi:hypothetical protein